MVTVVPNNYVNPTSEDIKLQVILIILFFVMSSSSSSVVVVVVVVVVVGGGAAAAAAAAVVIRFRLGQHKTTGVFDYVLFPVVLLQKLRSFQPCARTDDYPDNS